MAGYRDNAIVELSCRALYPVAGSDCNNAASIAADSGAVGSDIEKKKMKILWRLILVLPVLIVRPGFANTDLARAKNCISCHAAGNKVIGPAYKEIAARYAGDITAQERLVQKVLKGGSGVWGSVPMPANPQVSEAEAQTLVKWILMLR